MGGGTQDHNLRTAPAAMDIDQEANQLDNNNDGNVGPTPKNNNIGDRDNETGRGPQKNPPNFRNQIRTGGRARGGRYYNNTGRRNYRNDFDDEDEFYERRPPRNYNRNPRRDDFDDDMYRRRPFR